MDTTEMMEMTTGFNLTTVDPSDEKEEEYDGCWGVIPTNTLFLWLAIPSVVVIIVGSFFKQRKRLLPNCCSRRPGMMQPIDTLNPATSRRFSYAAAFGMTTQLCLNLFLKEHMPPEFLESTVVGGVKIQAIFRLVCVIIYVIALYPVFVAVYEDAILGYLIATPYVWLVLAVELANIEFCSRDLPDDVLQAMPENAIEPKYLRENLPSYVSGYAVRMLPLFAYEVFLAIWMPFRLIATVIRWHRRRKAIYQEKKKDIRSTPAFLHVQELVKKRPKQEAEGEEPKVPLKERFFNYFYPPAPGFRFSVRIICTFVVATTTIYMGSIDLIFDQWQTFKMWDVNIDSFEEDLANQGVQSAFASIGTISGFINPEGRDDIQATYRIFKICFYVAASLALFTALLSILFAIAAVRIDIIAVYRGNHDKIPRSDISAIHSLVVGSMKYSGLQIAYIIWGFLAHFTVFFTIGFIIGLVTQWEGLGNWIVEFLKANWVTILLPILMIITQILLARFLLTQEKQLALDNRKFYFNLIYTLFFYNIILGLFSCLLRIIKAIIVGLIFLPRLDQSLMPQRFQTQDPGFGAYIGFLHVENAHTNPILLMFCYFVQNALGASAERTMTTLPNNNKGSSDVVELHPAKTLAAKRVRNRLWVWHTLHHHPDLRFLRRPGKKEDKPKEEEDPGNIV